MLKGKILKIREYKKMLLYSLFGAISIILLIITVTSYFCHKRAPNVADDRTETNRNITRKILLLSYFRSGSSLLADLLLQLPDTFYHFEPLFFLTGDERVTSLEDVSKSLLLLQSLLECKFEMIPMVANASDIPWMYKYFYHNDHPFGNSSNGFPLMVQLDILHKLCLEKQIQLVKINRLRLKHVVNLIQDQPDLKVIYLARDPRALYFSRKFAGFCLSTESCINPYIFCPEIKDDLLMIPVLEQKLPDQFMALRYEDLVADTERVVWTIFRFLGFRYEVRHVMEQYTDSPSVFDINKDYFFGVNRDYPLRRLYRWKTALDIEEINMLEKICADAILLIKRLIK